MFTARLFVYHPFRQGYHSTTRKYPFVPAGGLKLADGLGMVLTVKEVAWNGRELVLTFHEKDDGENLPASRGWTPSKHLLPGSSGSEVKAQEEKFFGDIAIDDMRYLAREMEKRLVKDGDPFNGDDWSATQVCRCLLKLIDEYPGLKAGDELYRRGYEAIGACDISNYLARCEAAGKLAEVDISQLL